MFIAVHVGAGFHSHQKEAGYRDAMRQAVEAAAAALKAGQSSVEAVVAAIRVLEDCPFTNAGTGSNLSLLGSVECDASVMSGDGTFGAVAAVPGVQNPIAAAAALGADAKVPLPLGLVRPIMLAGDAARRYALAKGLCCAPDADAAGQWLITSEALKAWQRYSRMLEDAGYCVSSGGALAPQASARQQQQQLLPLGGHQAPFEPALQSPIKCLKVASSGADAIAAAEKQQQEEQQHRRVRQQQHDKQHIQHHHLHLQQQEQQHASRLADVGDTVGCIVVNAHGTVAAGVSSGGLAMKAGGRVGEAAVYGAGCWACQGSDKPDIPGVGLSASGVGEHIMKAGLARACGEALQTSSQPSACVDEQCSAELRRRILSGPEPWDCGLLAARVTMEASEAAGPNGSAASVHDGIIQAAADAPFAAAAGMGTWANGVVAGMSLAEQPAGSPTPNNSGHDDSKSNGKASSGTTVHVEFAAVHSAVSFAVAYIGPGMSTPSVDFMRAHDITNSQPLLAKRSFGSVAAAGGANSNQGRKAAQPAITVLGYTCEWAVPGALACT